jgi:DNA-directed RNA polymerase subunit RPC12/RpoP
LLSPDPPSQHDQGKQYMFPVDIMSPPITPHDYINPMLIQTDANSLAHNSPSLLQSSPSLMHSSPQLMLHHSPQLSLESPPLMMGGYDVEYSYEMNNMIPSEMYDTQWMQPNIPTQMLMERGPLHRVKQMKTAGSDASINSWSSQSSQPQGQFQCTFPGCNKVFSKQTNLKSHSRIHHTERNYACQDCGACFRRSHDLKRHQRSLHSDVKPFGCARCGKRFSRMVILF